jgi:hypothetical protein
MGKAKAKEAELNQSQAQVRMLLNASRNSLTGMY